MSRSSTLLALGCLAGGLGGCTHWRASESVFDQPVPERHQVQVFTDGEGRVVHGVVASPDSVSFVARHRAPDCDSCRVVVGRTEVDSVRVRAFSPSRTGVLIGVILAGLFIPKWPEDTR